MKKFYILFALATKKKQHLAKNVKIIIKPQ